MSIKTTIRKEQDQNIDQLKKQAKNLTCELLKERITRIYFQVSLLTQWREQCQQELNQILAGTEDCQSQEDSHG